MAISLHASRLMICLLMAVVCVSCGSSVITEPANEPPTLDAQQTGESTASESVAGFAAYDESIPETSMSASYWVTHDDLNSLSRSSDIAFVGRITDYTEAVLVVHDDPTEEPNPMATVYDGVVFTVDELLVGELPADETQVTIATRVLLRNKDGTPRFRVSASPIEIVRPGIFARNEPDRQRYIVYALAGHKGTPFYAAGVYFFNTPGGVAPILANDRIGLGADHPLVGTLEEAGIGGAIATEGEGTDTPTIGPGSESADSGLGLDDARTAARTTSYDLPEFSCDDEASAERFLLSFFESLSRKDAIAARSHIGSEEANFYAFVIYPDVVRDDSYHPLDYSQYGISTIDPQIDAVINQIEQEEPYEVEVFEYDYIGGSGRSGSEAHFRYDIKRGLLHQSVNLKGKGAFNCHEKKIVALIMTTHPGNQ